MFTAKLISNKSSLLNHIHVFNGSMSCKIFPNIGASIQQLSFNNINIIHGIDISENGLKSYKETYQSAILFPFTGRIPKGEYTYNNNSYKLKTNEDNRSNALHGLVYNKSFSIDICETSSLEAKIQLSYISDGALKGFPFKFKFQVTYLISNKGLKVNFDITNLDISSFPFGCGWHPYFKTDYLNKCSLSFSSKEKLVTNKDLVPIGFTQNKEPSTFTINNKSFDDTFILLKNEMTFKTNNYKAQMSFSQNHNGFLQIYTPKHRKSIAIEPISGAPNAFNSQDGLMELKPNENYSWNIDLKLKTRA